MKLLDIIKSWYNSADKVNLDHFDLQSIEILINKIKEEPFLTFMQARIEDLLYSISVSSKKNKGAERKFIIIDGVKGSGKTNLVYEYLKDFLISTGVILRNQAIIDKIASHDLTEIGLKGYKVEELIAEKEKNCKDGILIIDEFNAKDKNALVIADLIKRLYSNNDYSYTSVILMGEFHNNSSFIKQFDLNGIFLHKFRLSFYTPNCNQISEIFSSYAKREGKYSLTDNALSSLTFYFNKMKLLKELKASLNKEGKIRFSYKERNYVYTSEMFPIFKDIVLIKNVNNKVITEEDVLNTDSYKMLLDDLNRLKQYII